MGLQTKNLSERLRLDSNPAFIIFQFRCWKNLESRDFWWNSQMLDCNQCPVVCWREVFASHWGCSEPLHIFSSVGSSLRKPCAIIGLHGRQASHFFHSAQRHSVIRVQLDRCNITNTTQDSPLQSTCACCMSCVYQQKKASTRHRSYHMTECTHFTRCH